MPDIFGNGTTPHTFVSDKLRVIVQEAVEYFTRAPIDSFPASFKFGGGGVYALYYFGDFALYKKIALSEVEEDSRPIYIAKSWDTIPIY